VTQFRIANCEFRIGSSVILIVGLALSLVRVPVAAATEKPASVYRIGYVGGSASGSAPDNVFVKELRAIGWIEGQNIAIDYRWAGGDFTRIDNLAEDLGGGKIDVIVVSRVSLYGGFFAQRFPRTIPIVAFDPLGGNLGILARPGGNLTGISLMSADLGAKRLKLLREILPRLTRVDVLLRRGASGVVGEMHTAATGLGVLLRFVDVTDPSEFESAFSTVARDRAGAIIETSNDLFLFHRKQIADLALKRRLPAMYEFREHVEDGGLMSYGADLAELHRRAATYVDKILRGAKPGDLSVEQPTKFELVINLKTAKTMGLTFPQSVLIRADEVIQ
jgi:putative ABC transport system substrate-binding protein